MFLSAFRLHPYKLGFFLSIGQTFAIILSSQVSLNSQIHRYFPLMPSPPAVLGLLVSALSLLLVTKIRFARMIVWSSLILFACFSCVYLLDEPLKGYLVLCLLYLCWKFLSDIEEPKRQRPVGFRKQLLNVLFGSALLNWSLVHIFQFSTEYIAHVASLSSSLMVFSFFCFDTYFKKRSRGIVFIAIIAAMLIFIIPSIINNSHIIENYSKRCLSLILVSFLGLGSWYSIRQKIILSIESLFFHPEGAVTILFALFCCFGAVLLFSPLSAGNGVKISFLDAFFTAISAVCVTGLNTQNFPGDFSYFGQVLVLFLIQLGGLGIMTLSSLAVFIMGERMSIQQETTIAKMSGSKIKDKVQTTLATVMLFTLTVEFLGSLILTMEFLGSGLPFERALWKGIFTSISAFCNAGFALDADSLIGLKKEYLVLHTVGFMIILGGLSPAVVMAFPSIFRGERLPIHNRIALNVSIILQVSGFILFGLMEWNHSLAHLDFTAKFHHAWFQSVTARTAGFNSVDMTLTTQTTAIIMVVLMFVGGSPGGTAGGIKTTTVAILFAVVVSIIKGYRDVFLNLRKIPSETVMKAIGTFLVSLFIGVMASIALIATQNLPGIDLVFEVFSALGTVGLSRGITPKLDSIGKIVVMLCMFLGRVGPLSVFVFVFEARRKKALSYPSEDVLVG
jgi:trk system potassium uptake protein TrkH